MLVFGVVLLMALVHYFAFSYYLSSVTDKQDVERLQDTAKNISRFISVHQSVVDNISSQLAVRDLLVFGTDQEAHLWSIDMRRLLPDSIGLALFDDTARVKGDDEDLRLSERCYTDLRRRVMGLPIPEPPVHFKIAELAHFDLVSPIVDEGRTIGLLFASFSMDLIQNLLDTFSDQHQAYRIVTPEKYKVTGQYFDDMSVHRQYSIQVPGSDWVLEERIAEDHDQGVLFGLLVSNIVTVILITGILFTAFKHLFSTVVEDFNSLSVMMHRIQQGVYKADKMPATRLKETALVLKFMQHAADELNQYHTHLKLQSTTDELTELSNRRVLNDRFDEFLQAAGQGESIYVAVLDLDHFKQVNDRFGHDLGDEVIRLFARVLKQNADARSLCVRAGGDEFIVVLRDHTLEQVEHWYQRICDSFAESLENLFEKNGIHFEYGVSVGATRMIKGDRKRDALRRADEALYEVKKKGRNQIGFV